MNNNNNNITIQTKDTHAAQNSWQDGMVKTTASQVAEEAGRKFVTGIEKIKVQSIPSNIDGIPLAGQDNLTRLYISGDPAGNGTKTVSRVSAGVGPLPVIDNGTSIYVFLTNGHGRSSLLINIEGGTPYPVKYFGNTNTSMLGQIQANTLLELQFYDQAWHIVGALDYTPYIDAKVTSNSPIIAGTGTKINYDTKGLVIGSSALADSDIPPIPIDRVIGLSQVIATLSDPTVINNIHTDITTKLTANSPIVPDTATKVTYDAKGLILSGTDLTDTDIPTLQISKTQGLQQAIDSKIDKNSIIIPGTATKVSYDTKGLIIGASTLSANDIPLLDISKITNLQSVLDTKMVSNIPITPGTATKVTYDAKGLITAASNLLVTDVPDIPISKVTGLTSTLANFGSAGAISNLQSDLLTKVDKNDTIAGATHTKITYDTKGLVTGGADLIEADIPALSIAKTTNLQSSLDSKVNKNNTITAGTHTKITYDTKGLVTGGADLVATDIPTIEISQVNNLEHSLTSKANSDDVSFTTNALINSINAKLDKNNAIPGATFTKITYDAKGLVTAGEVLSASDIPTLAITKITGLQTALNTKADKNANITAGTATKITYDAKGFVTSGTNLIEADIPALSIAKTTNLQSSLDSKVEKNAPITANAATKVTYDAKGLITGGTNITKADVPNIDMSQVNDLSVKLDAKADKQYVDDLVISTQNQSATTTDLTALGNQLNMAISTKVDSNIPVVASTHTKISYDAKGLIIGGTDLTDIDIPTLQISKINNLQTMLDSKVNKNEPIKAGTTTKVTYDTKGLVLYGDILNESDIPIIQISKVNNLQETLDDKVKIFDFNNTTTDLTNKINTKLNAPALINPGFGVTKVWYDQYGVILSSGTLAVEDLPKPIPRDYIDNLPGILNRNLLTDIAFGYDTNNTTVVLTDSMINLESLAAGSNKINMPVASSTKPGIMPKESFAQIVQNTADIAAMKGANRRWAITSAYLPDDKTDAGQATLNADYLAASGSSNPNLGDSLLYIYAGNITFTWLIIDRSGIWVNRGVDTASTATNTSLGLVQGKNSAGKIFIENDGTMSLVGYDTLTQTDASLLNNINTRVVANAAITAATHTKITYDTKGLVTAGADLAEADIPLLQISKINNLQLSLNAKANITDVNASVNSLNASIGTKVTANAGISGATATKITYDNKGLVTAGATLVATDIPNIAISQVTNLQTNLDTKANATDVATSVNTLTTGMNNRVISNAPITATTATKVTYDSKGLVTAGTTLSASDIPALDWSKITSGKPGTLAGYGIGDAMPLSGGIFSGDVTIPTGKSLFFGATGENTDTIRVYRENPVSDVSDLILELGDNADGWDHFIIRTNGSDNHKFESNGNYTTAGYITAARGFYDGDNPVWHWGNFKPASKVDANEAIFSGTATKITYDAKGLVTAGTSLSASDIPTIEISQVNNLQYSLSTKANTADVSFTTKTIMESLVTKAPTASPTFTGTATAPTPVSTDNSTQIATTAFVKTAMATAGGVIVSATAPAGNATMLWVNSSTDVANYWNGTTWKPIVGVWGI